MNVNIDRRPVATGHFRNSDVDFALSQRLNVPSSGIVSAARFFSKDEKGRHSTDAASQTELGEHFLRLMRPLSKRLIDGMIEPDGKKPVNLAKFNGEKFAELAELGVEIACKGKALAKESERDLGLTTALLSALLFAIRGLGAQEFNKEFMALVRGAYKEPGRAMNALTRLAMESQIKDPDLIAGSTLVLFGTAAYFTRLVNTFDDNAKLIDRGDRELAREADIPDFITADLTRIARNMRAHSRMSGEQLQGFEHEYVAIAGILLTRGQKA